MSNQKSKTNLLVLLIVMCLLIGFMIGFSVTMFIPIQQMQNILLDADKIITDLFGGLI